jgi:predicted RNA methylase
MIVHPTRRNRIYLLCRTVNTRGIRGALRHYLSRLNIRTHERQDTPTDSSRTPDRFSQLPTPTDLRIPGVNAKWGVHYAPSREDIFRKALRSLPIRFQDYAFIDLGAGKGEMLLLAAEYEFRRVVGVEYSEALAAIASTNARTASGLMFKRVECIWADATEFDLPQDPAVLYLYNPFQGRVMDKVVRNIEQTLRAAPRDLWIVYVIHGNTVSSSVVITSRLLSRIGMFRTGSSVSIVQPHDSTSPLRSFSRVTDPAVRRLRKPRHAAHDRALESARAPTPWYLLPRSPRRSSSPTWLQ